MTRALLAPPARRFAAALLAALAAAGCGSLHSAPAASLDEARRAVEAARAAGPAGAEASRRAEAKLAMTRPLMEAKDYGPAQWLAEQAEVDAELALARAAAERARLAASRAL